MGINVSQMREACALARDVLEYGCSLVAPGVTTDEIDAKVHDMIVNADA
jgi:methionyl aminopeptidase